MAYEELCYFKLNHYYTQNLLFNFKRWVCLWHHSTLRVHLTVITHNETFKHAGVAGWLTDVIVSISDLCHSRHLEKTFRIFVWLFLHSLRNFLTFSVHLSLKKHLLPWGSKRLPVTASVKIHFLISLLWPITHENSLNSSQPTVDVLNFQNINRELRESWGFECAVGRHKEVCIFKHKVFFWMKHLKHSAISLGGKCLLTMQINQAVFTLRD